LSPGHRAPVTKQLAAHVVLILSLVLNVGININLSQNTKGMHMTKTTHQPTASTGHATKNHETDGNGCVGLRVGDTGSIHSHLYF